MPRTTRREAVVENNALPLSNSNIAKQQQNSRRKSSTKQTDPQQKANSQGCGGCLISFCNSKAVVRLLTIVVARTLDLIIKISVPRRNSHHCSHSQHADAAYVTHAMSSGKDESPGTEEVWGQRKNSTKRSEESPFISTHLESKD